MFTVLQTLSMCMDWQDGRQEAKVLEMLAALMLISSKLKQASQPVLSSAACPGTTVPTLIDTLPGVAAASLAPTLDMGPKIHKFQNTVKNNTWCSYIGAHVSMVHLCQNRQAQGVCITVKHDHIGIPHDHARTLVARSDLLRVVQHTSGPLKTLNSFMSFQTYRSLVEPLYLLSMNWWAHQSLVAGFR